VFGKKLIARDFDTARQFARECNMDALTMDGDEVNRKGALEGGFHDERRSKLKAYLGIVESKSKLDDAVQRQAKAQASSLEVDTDVAKVMGEIQKEEAKRANLKMQSAQTALELKQAAQDLSALEERLQKDKTDRLPAMKLELEALEAQADSYRNEMGTALQQSLSAADAKLLAELKVTSVELVQAAEAATKAFEEASVERQRLQSLLKDNLLLQRSEIQEKLSSAGGDGLGGDVDVGERALQLEQKRKELVVVSKEADNAAEAIRLHDKAALELKETIRKTKKLLDELKNKESRDAEELANAERQTEKQLNKRSMLVQKRDDSMRKIQQLGSLPAAELDEFAGDSAKELMKKLKKVNNDLTKYSHVNKKALDQYVNFSEQREGLLERKKELDKGAVAIEELITALDRQKEEAILRTFKGVSKHFSEVFKELVPQGKGQLIMRTSADAGDDDDDQAEDTQGSSSLSSSSGPRVHEFEGVQVIFSLQFIMLLCYYFIILYLLFNPVLFSNSSRCEFRLLLLVKCI
jgi:structural maintenance of chromosome 3 (chondroitin sulfate proteoglycan 6)